MSCLIHRHTLGAKNDVAVGSPCFCQGLEPGDGFSAQRCWFWFPSSLLVFNRLQLNDSQWLIHLLATQ